MKKRYIMPDVGESAPSFSLLNQNGERVELKDFKGRDLVIYFYPRADTPGCTTEACGFRDDWTEFEEENIGVVGISDDPVAKVAKFHSKYNLPFDLLSDEGGKVGEMYDSYGEKKMYGKTYMGVKRNTYVVDSKGKIIQTYLKVKVADHSKKILDDLR